VRTQEAAARAAQQGLPAHPIPLTPRPHTPPPTSLSFLLFYYIGVSKVLQQLGVIRPGSTKV
jgi:hypothetical protein